MQLATAFGAFTKHPAIRVRVFSSVFLGGGLITLISPMGSRSVVCRSVFLCHPEMICYAKQC